MCKKITHFESIKVSNPITLKLKYFVNKQRSAGYLQNLLIYNTLILIKRLLIMRYEHNQSFFKKQHLYPDDSCKYRSVIY